MLKSLENAAKNAVTNYIQTINCTLTEAQRVRLVHVLHRFGSPTVSVA